MKGFRLKRPENGLEEVEGLLGGHVSANSDFAGAQSVFGMAKWWFFRLFFSEQKLFESWVM
jgi:hypothetical protein